MYYIYNIHACTGTHSYIGGSQPVVGLDAGSTHNEDNVDLNNVQLIEEL